MKTFDEKIPYLKNAVYWSNLNGFKVVDGMCRIILPSSISKLGSKHIKSEVLEAEKLLQGARSLVQDLSEELQLHQLGMLDQRISMHLLGKSKILGEEIEYKDVYHIAQVTF